MQLAKNVIDVGLSTNNLEPMLGFWQKEAGLRFDHVLPVRRGQKQYRHDAMGSVVKLNHHPAPLQNAPQSGADILGFPEEPSPGGLAIRIGNSYASGPAEATLRSLAATDRNRDFHERWWRYDR